MAEVKNSFLSSKMNQDLDDRLIPNGEYREALNVSIGKSESSDVGTLQNIKGNQLIGTANIIPGMECIGYYMDNANNRIFQFLTNESDNNGTPVYHQITVYDFNSNIYTILVEGAFLNFQKALPITGITLLETLLFWTDYNNQPRKINVQTALTYPATTVAPGVPYYTNEEHISVAKYAPIDPISLYKKVVTTNRTAVSSSTSIPVANATNIIEGMTLLGDAVTSNEFVIVESVDLITSTVVVSRTVTFPINTELTFLISTMTDKSADPAWPGDPAYLKERYVRFSYRFRLDDGEYTLMAPFTQIAFIPNQKGYFINGDETDAYTSTVLKWFENNVNNIQLLVPFPDLISKVNQSYKIQALDILYKESDGLDIKVLDTILYPQLAQNVVNNSNIYLYDYQSRKPYKVLPTDQTTRVYDIVPVKAKAQETASNRIMYGNFLKGHTAPHDLNYQVSVSSKQDYSFAFIEYPNHTVKQNRTYQVGFILSDKFGRQSSVILSSLDNIATVSGGIKYGGSTVYSPYYSSSNFPSTKDWFGNAISVLLNSPITSTKDPNSGTPGLYAQPTSNTGFKLTGTTTITSNTYTFTPLLGTLPKAGDYLRGQFTDYVKVTVANIPTPPVYNVPYTITTDGQVNELYSRDTSLTDDIKYAYTINVLGWYSYKIVVRQQEQDYYNVYLPGFLNGYPKGQTYGSNVTYDSTGKATTHNGVNTTTFPTNEGGLVAHAVLINDNINKIPRDLVEVGPDQKLYRSSVQLFGRVENTQILDTPTTSYASNRQYFPAKKADTAIAIGTAADLQFLPYTVDNTFGSAVYNFYQLETTPSVVRVSTTKSLGVTAAKNIPGVAVPENISAPENMTPYLSVYETKPDYSLLDIFWETSTSGLVSDLNWDVLTGYEGSTGVTEINWGNFTEALDPSPSSSSKYITNEFWPISPAGVPIDSSAAVLTVRDANNLNCDQSFGLEVIQETVPFAYKKYRIYATQYQVFTNDTSISSYMFYFAFIQAGQSVTTTYSFPANLQNENPIIKDLTGGNLPSSVTVFLPAPLTTGQPIYKMLGVNGSNPGAGAAQNIVDLSWKINNLGSTANWQNYFNITTDPTTKLGGVYQTAALANGQTITLNVELWDSSTSTGIPVPGTDGVNVFGSLPDNILLNVSLAATLICNRRFTSINYNGTTFRDGYEIPQAHNATEWKNATSAMWCWPNFDPHKGFIYGRMYNGYALEGLWDPNQFQNRKTFAPQGTRLPYANEKCIFKCAEFGNSYAELGGHMKSISPAPPFEGSWQVSPSLPNDNSTGFGMLPGGYMTDQGVWVGEGEKGWFAAMSSPFGSSDGGIFVGWFYGLSYNSSVLSVVQIPGPITSNEFIKRHGGNVRLLEPQDSQWLILQSGSQYNGCNYNYVDSIGSVQNVYMASTTASQIFTTAAACTINNSPTPPAGVRCVQWSPYP